MTSRPFHYDLDEERGVLVLHGELDEPASTELRETITKATKELTSGLAIDLADVTFLPSPAIGVLATAKDGRSQPRRHDHLRGPRRAPSPRGC